MNTKIAIISIALILMFPKTVSIGSVSQKASLHFGNQSFVIAPTDSKHNPKPIDWTFDWSYDDATHHGHNQSDDDNKSHHFHYDRFARHRNKILLSILLKIVLIITHLSSLAYASIHILH